MLATRLTRLAAAVALATGCVGCDLLLRLREDLELTADSTSLGAGESVRVSVQKKASWFRAAGPMDPSQTTYWTTSESMLVVEPDGWVTCVGTAGQPTESAWIAANNGASHGHLIFGLRPDGPGPTLELVTATADMPSVPQKAQGPFAPCCSTLLALKEGQQMRFRIQSRATRRELTSSETGTRYTLFFGSGIPNDSRPSVITGGPDTVTARTFLLDDKQGVMTAPDTIGSLNYARVIVFFRNGPLVGWREIVVIHK